MFDLLRLHFLGKQDRREAARDAEFRPEIGVADTAKKPWVGQRPLQSVGFADVSCAANSLGVAENTSIPPGSSAAIPSSPATT